MPNQREPTYALPQAAVGRWGVSGFGVWGLGFRVWGVFGLGFRVCVI